MQIDKTIKVSDLLTVMTIIFTVGLSAITILNSVSKDRELEERAQAAAIRNAAAQTLIKLERWQSYEMLFFDMLSPEYVKMSKKLEPTPNDENVLGARDDLWEEIEATRVRTKQEIITAEINTAHIDVYGYFPEMVREAQHQLEALEEQIYNEYIKSTQDGIRAFSCRENMHLPYSGSDYQWNSGVFCRTGSYTSAMLGNDLRYIAGLYQTQLLDKSNEIIRNVRSRLEPVFTMSDVEVLKWQPPTAMPTTPAPTIPATPEATAVDER